jgi:tetratricopeptide (TPR) repeat protein
MVRDTRLGGARLLCAAWLMALTALLGCATSGSQLEQERQIKQARAQFELGVDHVNNGRVELGLRSLIEAERLDPNNAHIHHALGDAYTRKGKIEEAERHLLRALELYPAYHEARLRLSNLYIHLKRYHDVIAEAQTLLDDPTFPAPWRALANRGWAEFRLGRMVEARRDLELAYETNEKYWPALLNLGILEAQEGHHPRAIDLFEEMLALRPRSSAVAEANYRLAEIYVSIGKRERAVGHLMTAVAQAPGDVWGKKSEKYLKLLR